MGLSELSPLPDHCVITKLLQVQTIQQRQRNAKFAKENEARMGKSEDQLKKKVKEVRKSPISMFWLGTFALEHLHAPQSLRCSTWHCRFPGISVLYLITHSCSEEVLISISLAVLGFVIFGGLVFEALTRFFA
ncbi:hypothetical protein HJFPF1_06763 [Paramyrothecium foliicola]|nr:hypothetical protein HJFPF1_06763 [Paramyrothecium foliicola]